MGACARALKFVGRLPILAIGPGNSLLAGGRCTLWIHDRDPVVPANLARVRNAVRRFEALFPAARGVEAVESWAGNVDLMPDGIPVLGPVAALPGLILATGLTGHGFSMGPIVGKLTSETALDGRPSLDLAAFRFERYAEGRSGKSSTRY